MTTAVVRETLKQTLRTAKYATCLEGLGFGTNGEFCSRSVFSCSTLECPQRPLCNRWAAETRRYQLYGVQRIGLAWHHHAECITHQECWKCGTAIDPNMEQYFCACGVVQPPIEKRSLYQVMGLEQEEFDIDLKSLAEKYRDLQRILHPDKYSQKSEKERNFSIQHSSLVNKAYRTLQKPLTRGLYLLRLKEEDLEKESHVDLEFLDEIMETNESIIEADSREEMIDLDTKNRSNIDHLVRQISEAFRANDRSLAKTLLVHLKYYTNIEEKIKDFKIKYAE